MKLRSIDIENYRGVQSLRIPLDSLCLRGWAVSTI